MMPFRYMRARTVAEAMDAVASTPDARFVAGGTNLVDLMKLGIEAPALLVDINGLDLRGIRQTANGGLRIGALVSNSDVAADPVVRRDYGVLARAIVAGASGQLRNRATVGGNLMQRVRCPYFYDPAQACNKRLPGSGCPAMDGVNRSHAVLAVRDSCIAVNPGDMAVALEVLDAGVEILTAAGGHRRLTIAEFFSAQGPGVQQEVAIGPHDLILAVVLPPPLRGLHAYHKVRDRASYAFALVSAAYVRSDDGLRIAFGGLAHRPWRSRAAEAAQADGPDAMADILFANAQTTPQNAFKIALARRLLVAALSGTGDAA